jgi:DNA repair protein RadA
LSVLSDLPITTGSANLDTLLGGGLPVCSVTDIYGPFATGKTQFAFQNVVMTGSIASSNPDRPSVVFVDCAGSFRPERIAEIAEQRGINASKILSATSAVSVRSVADQIVANTQLFQEDKFSKCRLVIIDDVTANFTSEMNSPEQIVERQSLLSSYIRKLAYFAITRKASVLLTNAVRAKGEGEPKEATGDIISEHVLFRLSFRRQNTRRIASVEQPILARNSVEFEVSAKGIL